MISHAELDELLRPNLLHLPRQPRVLEIKHQPYVDSEGQDALRIWVIFDNKTKPSQRRWKNLAPVERAIREALDRAGVDLWPYFKYRTKAEYKSERKKA